MGEKKKPNQLIFWDNTGLLQASVPSFRDPLLRSSLPSLSCKGPSLRLLCINHRFPKLLFVHTHLMTLKHWTEAKFIGSAGHRGPQTAPSLCLPSTCPNISASCISARLLMDGIQVISPQTVPVCNTGQQSWDNARGHSYWIQCYQQKGPAQAALTPAGLVLTRRMGDSKTLARCPGQKLCMLSICLVNLLDCISRSKVLKTQHLEWCYLPRTCKALPALAAAPVLLEVQDHAISMHSLITAMRILRMCKSPPKGQRLCDSYRNTH